MNADRRFVTLFLLLILLLAPLGDVKAQASEDIHYFPETGHHVKGKFLRFYNRAVNPELVFGYPITEQFTSTDGKTVQYFQRARFELDEESIQLTPLGRALYPSGSQKLDINNPAACRSFRTGYSVCFAFLDFYQVNNGEILFGDPISTFEFHENLIVQYFEKARFEWRADKPEGQRVVLSDLGRLYFDRLAENPVHLRSLRPLDATISPILSISARAFVGNAITVSSGQQTVHIIVQSQTHQPVQNATGKATVRFSDHRSEDYFFSTNPSGLGSVSFDFNNQIQGELIQIDILVTYQGLSAKTTTSYRVWY